MYEGASSCADPSNWGFSPAINQQFANQFLTDRATVAARLGKPWMLEETGADVSYWLLLHSSDLTHMQVEYLFGNMSRVHKD